MIVPSGPDARSPDPRGPDEFSPTGGRVLRADWTSAVMWASRHRISSSRTGRSEAGGSDGIRGGTERVGAHVAGRYGLAGGSRSRGSYRSRHLGGRHTTDEATTNLLRSVQLSSGKRPRAGDERARTIVSWSFSLEQRDDPLCTIGRPSGDQAPIGFAHRLRRSDPPNSMQLIIYSCHAGEGPAGCPVAIRPHSRRLRNCGGHAGQLPTSRMSTLPAFVDAVKPIYWDGRRRRFRLHASGGGRLQGVLELAARP
jgi:hypothetical protein